MPLEIFFLANATQTISKKNMSSPKKKQGFAIGLSEAGKKDNMMSKLPSLRQGSYH